MTPDQPVHSNSHPLHGLLSTFLHLHWWPSSTPYYLGKRNLKARKYRNLQTGQLAQRALKDFERSVLKNTWQRSLSVGVRMQPFLLSDILLLSSGLLPPRSFTESLMTVAWFPHSQNPGKRELPVNKAPIGKSREATKDAAMMGLNSQK